MLRANLGIELEERKFISYKELKFSIENAINNKLLFFLGINKAFVSNRNIREEDQFHYLIALKRVPNILTSRSTAKNYLFVVGFSDCHGIVPRPSPKLYIFRNKRLIKNIFKSRPKNYFVVFKHGQI